MLHSMWIDANGIISVLNSDCCTLKFSFKENRFAKLIGSMFLRSWLDHTRKKKNWNTTIHSVLMSKSKSIFFVLYLCIVWRFHLVYTESKLLFIPSVIQAYTNKYICNVIIFVTDWRLYVNVLSSDLVSFTLPFCQYFFFVSFRNWIRFDLDSI